MERTERAGVVALIVRVLDKITFEHAVIATTHLLHNLSLFAAARARRFVATTQNSVVWSIVDVIERVHIPDTGP